jgi:uncharacterized membrane protein YbhN (UPF0104 family)
MAMASYKKRFVFVLKLGVSLAFIFWLARRVDWPEVWSIVKGAQIAYLALYALLLVAGIGISAYKWQAIARRKGFGGGFKGYFIAYLSGMFINNFLPSFIGGDTYRAYWLGKTDRGYASAASTVILDRFSGLLAAMALTLFFSIFHVSKVLQSPLWLVLDLVILAVGAFVLAWPWLSRLPHVQVSAGLVPDRLRALLSEIGGYGEGSVLLPAFALSVLFNVVGVGSANLALFWALGSPVAAIDYFAVIFLISIVSSIPVSINNIGVKEWAYYTFFGIFGMNPEIAVTAALLGRLIQMAVSFFSLPAYLGTRLPENTEPR